MIGSRVIVCAPVAERAWILPKWFECLSQQTRRPDGFCFIHSDSQDDTYTQLVNPIAPSDIVRVKQPYLSRDQRNSKRDDPHRAKEFCYLRNELRKLFQRTYTLNDIFVSLDTDVLLEDPQTLEVLVKAVSPGPVGNRFPTQSLWDVACARTCLHPLGEQSQCYNAGMLGGGEGFDQVWQRVDANLLTYAPPVRIDIPMACFAARAYVVGTTPYRPHECGEDVGFAQALKQRGFRVAWYHNLIARHVWDPSRLESGDRVVTHA